VESSTGSSRISSLPSLSAYDFDTFIYRCPPPLSQERVVFEWLESFIGIATMVGSNLPEDPDPLLQILEKWLETNLDKWPDYKSQAKQIIENEVSIVQ
jgi:hypothetical protein